MLIIDGDIICYRIGFSKESVDLASALQKVDNTITEIVWDLNDDNIYIYLTGKGNFRDEVAITAPYKGNRKGDKPEFYTEIREHLINEWEATVTEGIEADDAIAIMATHQFPHATIVSIDKDFDQVPGWHYNPVKKERYYIEEDEGLLNFYMQFLVGDRIDNILGVKGIGPVKARKLLEDKTEVEMFQKCVELLGYDRAVENGKLLWLQRYEGEIWEPTYERSEYEEEVKQKDT